MYGEAWNMPTACDEGTVMANQNNLKQLNDRIGAFDDTIRDAIKGSTGGTDGAFVQEASKNLTLRLAYRVSPTVLRVGQMFRHSV